MRSSYAFLAVASAVVVSANPLLFGRSACNADNCALAVTGTDAQPASTARKSDCTSFMLHWPTGAVPTYASACSGSVRYSSACSCYGITATSNSSTSSTPATTTATAATSSKSTASPNSSTGSKASSTNSTITTSTKTTSTNSKTPSVTSSTTSKNSSTHTTASPTITSASSHSSNSTISSNTTTTTNMTCSHPTCLSDTEATAVVNSFIYLLANPTASNFISKANELLCDNFTDTSDSINSLAGIPLGQTTFNNKTAFIAGSGSQSPLTLKTYDIFHSCRKIAWRWVIVGGAGDGVDEVKGIDTFYTDGCGHICQIFAEFNTAAWLYNLGEPECSPTSMISFASTLTSSTASATATANNTTTSA